MEQEMVYLEESQVWTCPMGGRWKVICVGGGASGGLCNGAMTHLLQKPGETTSFGSYLSAAGGHARKLRTAIHANATLMGKAGGYGGYDGLNFGGNPEHPSLADSNYVPPSYNGGLLGDSGTGYGAGGGAIDASLTCNATVTTGSASGSTTSTKAVTAPAYCVSGKNGEIRTRIVNLDDYEEVACVIGNNSRDTVVSTDDEDAIVALLKSLHLGGAYATTTEVQMNNNIEAINGVATSGNKGVIILQYLGGTII